MSIAQFAGGIIAAAAEKVTLSGESVSDSAVSAAFASISFQSNGQVHKTEGVTSTQVDSATDWIIPNAAAPGTYEVRLSGRTGTAPTGPAENTWHALSTTRTWSLTNSSPPSTISCSFTIEIRKGSTVLASATYSLSAEAF